MSFFFFFQAEDGIRDKLVTGVQTCALPILPYVVIAGNHSQVCCYRLLKIWIWICKLHGLWVTSWTISRRVTGLAAVPFLSISAPSNFLSSRFVIPILLHAISCMLCTSFMHASISALKLIQTPLRI